MIVVTPLFAAVFTLMYLGLSINVIRQRLGNKVSLGDGGHSGLRVAIRTQANFFEYVPLILVLMWFIETLTFSSSTVFWMGSFLLVSRIFHVLGMLYPRNLLILRQLGTIGTFAVMVKAALALFHYYIPLSI